MGSLLDGMYRLECNLTLLLALVIIWIQIRARSCRGNLSFTTRDVLTLLNSKELVDQSELDISTLATSTQSRKVMFWGWALQMRFFQAWRRVKRRSSLMEFKNTTMSFFGKSINLFAKSMLLTWKSLQLEFTQTITATLYSRHLKLIHTKVRAVPFPLKSGNRQPTISR